VAGDDDHAPLTCDEDLEFRARLSSGKTRTQLWYCRYASKKLLENKRVLKTQ